jgi:hypothetical protein
MDVVLFGGLPPRLSAKALHVEHNHSPASNPVRAPIYFLMGTPLVVKRCVPPELRTGRRVPAAFPVPGG